MKLSDIEKLHDLGLITTEQQQKIIQTLDLKEDSSRLLWILSALGAVLVVTGIILLISANWDAIPRGIKIGTGLTLMLGAWAGGYVLREVRRDYAKTGEALYLIGAGLWLANIALLGQIYHLSSRTPNAFLLWLAGIAATPWILRSRALFVLSLISFGIWVGAEANCDAGLFGGEWESAQLVLYSLLGLAVLGWGYALRGSAWQEFSVPAEKFGLLACFLAAYPLCWIAEGWFHSPWSVTRAVILVTVALGALASLALGLRNPQIKLDPQWRWTWGGTLAAVGTLLCVAVLTSNHDASSWPRYRAAEASVLWFVAIALFVTSLLQVQVGIALRSKFMINLAITMTGLILLAVYVNLFGSMATTGWMLLLSGVFLIAFGIYLERKRRKFIARIRAGAAAQLQPTR